jgi:hypothetical protein
MFLVFLTAGALKVIWLILQYPTSQNQCDCSLLAWYQRAFPEIYTLYPWSSVQIVSVDVYLRSKEFSHCAFSTVECIPLCLLVQFWVHCQIFFYCWRSMCGQMFVMKWIMTGLFECAGVRHHLRHINFGVKGSPWVSGMLYMHTYTLSGLTTEMFLLYFLLLYFIVARVISKQRSYFHC